MWAYYCMVWHMRTKRKAMAKIMKRMLSVAFWCGSFIRTFLLYCTIRRDVKFRPIDKKIGTERFGKGTPPRYTTRIRKRNKTLSMRSTSGIYNEQCPHQIKEPKGDGGRNIGGLPTSVPHLGSYPALRGSEDRATHIGNLIQSQGQGRIVSHTGLYERACENVSSGHR